MQVMNYSTYEYGIRWWSKSNLKIYAADYSNDNYYFILGGWVKIDSSRYMPAMVAYSTYTMIYITQYYSDHFAHKWFIGFQDET